MRLACLIGLAGITGCLSIPSQSSCDYRPGLGQCTDLTNNPNSDLASTLMEFCTLGSGKFSTSLCDHSGSFGGCECDACDNGISITWYFTDADAGIASAADVMAKCGSGHAYHAP